MTKPHILLVNPPIYDFTAYDFWLRPYGMLRVAGQVRKACRFTYFNYLVTEAHDPWGRGRFRDAIIPKPAQFRDLPRNYRRFGRPRRQFRELLAAEPFDAVLVQTGMTYWYPGVREVIDDVRELQPDSLLVLGGTYPALCPAHARSLETDLLIPPDSLGKLWDRLGVLPEDGPPLWEVTAPDVGIIKLTEGCPFRCSYCSVPVIQPGFAVRPVTICVEELQHLARLGIRNVAFYDDALLYRVEDVLIPVLRQAAPLNLSFHTPNALNARFIDGGIAELMVQAGVRSFFLGLENGSSEWLAATGGKVRPSEFADAVLMLRSAGAQSISAYVMIGHPDSDWQQVEATMEFVHNTGTRIMLAEFAPIPGTADGARCGYWADLDEPLAHNKTAFTIRRLGIERVNQLKSMCRRLNESPH
jgi:hypothetical protein